jgi:hypothetical protein
MHHMRPRRWVILWSVLWAAYAGLVFLWSAGGGSFGDRLAGPLILLGMGVSLVTGLGAGLCSMELARRNRLKKRRAILAVLVTSVVSAIVPPLIWLVTSWAAGDPKGLNAVVLAFVTFPFGIIGFVAFNLGILCTPAKGRAGGGVGTDPSGSSQEGPSG